MAKTETPRQTAEAKLGELEGEVARIRAGLEEAQRAAQEAGEEMNATADAREDHLARGDMKAAEAARVATAEAAGRLNIAATRLRGLTRLLREKEAALPAVALEVAEATLAELEHALAEARAGMDARPGEDSVARYVDAFRETFSLRQEVFRVAGDTRHAPGTFDVKAELERRHLLSLAPDHVQFAHVPKPRLREEWRARIGAHLEAFKVAREQREFAARSSTPPRRQFDPMRPLGAA